MRTTTDHEALQTNVRDPMPAPEGTRIRRILGPLAELPFLSLQHWAVVLVGYTALSLGGTFAVRFFVYLAMRVSGVDSITDRSITLLVRSPVALSLLIAAGVAAVVATSLWFTLLVTMTRQHIRVRSFRYGPVASELHSALKQSVRGKPLACAAVLGLIAPLVGAPIFAPATSGMRIPPFISREFLKVPLTATIWSALAVAAILVVGVCAIWIGRFCDPGATPGSTRSSLRGRRGAVNLLAVAAVIPLSALGNSLDDTLSPTANPFLATAHIAYVLIAQALMLVLSRKMTPSRYLREQRSPGARRSTSRFLLTMGVIGVCITTTAATSPPGMPLVPDKPATVIAHRGFDTGGPENTIAGLEAAAALGPDYVEVDVMQVADGGFVASHDTNLLALGGRDIDITTMTTAEATSIEISMHGHADRIPEMAAYVTRAKELHVQLLIEVKVTGHEQAGYISDMLAELTELDGISRNIFHSLDPRVVTAIHRQRPDARVGLTIAIHAGPLPDVPADFYVVEQSSITGSLIRQAHDRGVPIYAWTVNDPRAMQQLIRAGVDGIVSDALEDAVELRNTKSPGVARAPSDSPGSGPS
jgi:glycerophosphoryl diester phosphodiesterase